MPNLWRFIVSLFAAVLLAIVSVTFYGRLRPNPWELVWAERAQDRWSLAPGIGELRIAPYSLPIPPFRLEIITRFSGDSDAKAYWLVRTRYLTLYVFGYGRYSITGKAFTGSVWLRPVGEMNQISLDVDSNLSGTLRLNGQIAWQGVITPQMLSASSGQWVIEAQCNCQSGSSAKLTWISLAVYRTTLP